MMHSRDPEEDDMPDSSAEVPASNPEAGLKRINYARLDRRRNMDETFALPPMVPETSHPNADTEFQDRFLDEKIRLFHPEDLIENAQDRIKDAGEDEKEVILCDTVDQINELISPNDPQYQKNAARAAFALGMTLGTSKRFHSTGNVKKDLKGTYSSQSGPLCVYDRETGAEFVTANRASTQVLLFRMGYTPKEYFGPRVTELSEEGLQIVHEQKEKAKAEEEAGFEPEDKKGKSSLGSSPHMLQKIRNAKAEARAQENERFLQTGSNVLRVHPNKFTDEANRKKRQLMKDGRGLPWGKPLEPASTKSSDISQPDVGADDSEDSDVMTIVAVKEEDSDEMGDIPEHGSGKEAA